MSEGEWVTRLERAHAVADASLADIRLPAHSRITWYLPPNLRATEPSAWVGAVGSASTPHRDPGR